MPAAVETMAYRQAGGLPWHGLGTPIGDEVRSPEEILKVTGTDWRVVLRPLWTNLVPTADTQRMLSAGSQVLDLPASDAKFEVVLSALRTCPNGETLTRLGQVLALRAGNGSLRLDELSKLRDAYGERRADLRLAHIARHSEGGAVRQVPRMMATVRSSDGQPLGVVGSDYKPIQNRDCAEFASVVGGLAGCRLETGGALFGGRVVWYLVDLPGAREIVSGDPVQRKLFIHNAHDGSRSLRALFTSVRVVCANTAAVALSQGKAEGITVRHTKNANVAIEEARRVLGIAVDTFDDFEARCRLLAGQRITIGQVATFAERVFPEPQRNEDEPRSKRVPGFQRAREAVIDLYETGKGNALPGVRGTAWAAYNALTEYVDHGKARRALPESTMHSKLLGDGALLKRRALDVLEKVLA